MIWKSTPKQTDNFHLNFYDPFKIKRRKRTTQEQTNALEQVFQIYSKPTAKIRFLLSERLSMSPRSIQIWFQNRRAKEKK
ncbi:Homeodomain-like protein, partial [Mycotypha africana]|uniref:Homeodomain-like protein n=1 Tax=Mycotypha africana TaxID=64632 RepID=UPI002301423D